MKTKFYLQIFLIGFFMSTTTACTHTSETTSLSEEQSALPAGFVYLSDVIPGVKEELRYPTPNNFMGRPVAGYLGHRAILTAQAAQALKAVQNDIAKDGYELVIYDAYRPRQATQDFAQWGQDPIDNPTLRERYYPRVPKDQIAHQGYIAERSTHTRGSTVDLTLIVKGQDLQPITYSRRTFHDGFSIIYMDDGTVDMGSSFDLFDEVSHNDCTLVPAAAQEMRNYLRKKMMTHGFNDYPQEWWHYTLKNEPFPHTYFDFPVR
jgi:D-alanyl-D-alanine dipeptidase